MVCKRSCITRERQFVHNVRYAATVLHPTRSLHGDARLRAPKNRRPPPHSTQDGDRRGTTDLRATLPDRRVSACLDQAALRFTAVPVSRPSEGNDGSYL